MQYARKIHTTDNAATPLRKTAGLGLATLAALALAAALPQAACAQNFNGDFSTGTLAGFTTPSPGLVSIVTSYNNGDNGATFTLPTGGHFAVLHAGAGSNAYTTLSQTFTAAAGQTLSGKAFFDAGDYVPYNDNGYVKVVNNGQVLFSSSVASVGNYGATPWTGFSYTFGSGGTYTVQAGVENYGDNGNPSQLGLGDVALSATPAPEPSSVAAFAFTGLFALGLVLKARRRTA